MIATIIIIVLVFGNVFISFAKDGEPVNGRYDFWTSLIASLIKISLLYAAGLFDKFNS